MVTWTLTPAGDGERTLVRVDAVVRDPALDGRFSQPPPTPGLTPGRCASEMAVVAITALGS